MVPRSTLKYVSRLSMVTFQLRYSRMAPSDAAAMLLPRDDTTPLVTKTYLVITIDAAMAAARVGNGDYSRSPRTLGQCKCNGWVRRETYLRPPLYTSTTPLSASTLTQSPVCMHSSGSRSKSVSAGARVTTAPRATLVDISLNNIAAGAACIRRAR